MPSIVTVSARGTLTWYTPPLILPARPRARATPAVSRSIVAGGPAVAAAVGVLLRAHAARTAAPILVGSPRALICMYMTRGDSCRR